MTFDSQDRHGSDTTTSSSSLDATSTHTNNNNTMQQNYHLDSSLHQHETSPHAFSTTTTNLDASNHNTNNNNNNNHHHHSATSTTPLFQTEEEIQTPHHSLHAAPAMRNHDSQHEEEENESTPITTTTTTNSSSSNDSRRWSSSTTTSQTSSLQPSSSSSNQDEQDEDDTSTSTTSSSVTTSIFGYSPRVRQFHTSRTSGGNHQRHSVSFSKDAWMNQHMLNANHHHHVMHDHNNNNNSSNDSQPQLPSETTTHECSNTTTTCFLNDHKTQKNTSWSQMNNQQAAAETTTTTNLSSPSSPRTSDSSSSLNFQKNNLVAASSSTPFGSTVFPWTTKKGQSEKRHLKFLKDAHVEERTWNSGLSSSKSSFFSRMNHDTIRNSNHSLSTPSQNLHATHLDLQRRLSQCLPTIFTDWKRVIDFQSTCMLVLIILDYTFMIIETCVKKGWLNGLILTTLCVIGFTSVKWSFLRDLPHYVNVNTSSVWKTIGSLQEFSSNNVGTSDKKIPKDESSWVAWLSSYMPNRFSSTQLVFLNLVLFTSKFMLAESKSVVTPMSLFSIASIAGCKYRDSFIRNRRDIEWQQTQSVVESDEEPKQMPSNETSADLEAVLWSQVPFYYIALHYVCYMAYKTFQFFTSTEKPLTLEEILRELLTLVVDYFPSISMVLIFGGFVVFASVYISIEYKKLTDITKKLSQALEVKNNFLSHVSHELRTPLLSSLGSIELMKETNLSNEQAGHLEVIQASNSVLLTLIEDIFLFIDLDRAPKNMTPMNTRKASDDNPSIEHKSTSELTRFQEHSSAFSISKSILTILDILQNYSNKFQIKIECYIDDSIKSLIVFANQTRLQQCLLNILTNAVKASKPNGVVELYCSKVDPQPQLSEKHLSSMNRDMRNVEWFEISIVDHGIGIPKDKQKSIFEPFQQLHNLNEAICPGTGLGLCTAKRIVDQMGGWIDLQSEPNVGSTFTLYLPFQVESTHGPIMDTFLEDQATSTSSRSSSSSDELTHLSHGTYTSSSQQGHEGGEMLATDSSESSSLRNNNVLPSLKLSEINSPLHNAIQRQLQIQENYLEQFEKTQRTFNESPRPKSANSKIIVAEDNSINRQVLLKLLSNLGFGQADAVCDGQELVEAFDVNKHKLILTDMHMPKKNGLEASQIIRQKYQDKVKIIMLTADALTDFSTEQYMRTVDAVLCKPCTKQKLKETIETFLK
ncbi:hypothetical protein C9374_011049 [Naegleria lovaniensis]|uniref:histidine kinase n=1 Tax=Naegleria lovaniensis TaxID=51637 RepID=A0AA88KIS3_NAELO|nr:uncharacterized protein C9374_011049 [Naegleria lovaniensis]KAG2374212.1 hypothetical protein C9374_011049 [Naegleria lovaniensis]